MARLGSAERPAIVRVQTMRKAEEIMRVADEHGWKVLVGVEPDKPEDLTDMDRLLQRQIPSEHSVKPRRNDPCPCGSGKKYKKCCGQVSGTPTSDVKDHMDQKRTGGIISLFKRR